MPYRNAVNDAQETSSPSLDLPTNSKGVPQIAENPHKTASKTNQTDIWSTIKIKCNVHSNKFEIRMFQRASGETASAIKNSGRSFTTREQDRRIPILEERFRNIHQEQNTRIFNEVRMSVFNRKLLPNKRQTPNVQAPFHNDFIITRTGEHRSKTFVQYTSGKICALSLRTSKVSTASEESIKKFGAWSKKIFGDVREDDAGNVADHAYSRQLWLAYTRWRQRRCGA